MSSSSGATLTQLKGRRLSSSCSSMTSLTSGGQPGQTLRGSSFMEVKPHVAASSRQNPRPLGSTERSLNVPSGNAPENSIIVREALRMDLPRHLVLGNVRRRVQTHGANYTDMKELVADLFAADGSRSSKNQGVPMETNQLEEALMMSSPVVWGALRKGAPPHLIKPKLRAKILSNGVGYADVSELLTDLDMKQVRQN